MPLPVRSLSLIIPAYNEEKRLDPFLASIQEYVRRRPADVGEIIVVDDGSTDGTLAVAESYRDRLPAMRILSHGLNRGKGAAVRSGVLAAQGDRVVFMDADGATDASELPKMIDALASAEIGVGNRWMAGAETTNRTPLRRLASLIYRLLTYLVGLGEIDSMCGFKGFHIDVARGLFQDLSEERWLFDFEIMYRARREGRIVQNVPIRWCSKDGSKLSIGALLQTMIRILPLFGRLRRRPSEVRVVRPARSL